MRKQSRFERCLAVLGILGTLAGSLVWPLPGAHAQGPVAALPPAPMAQRWPAGKWMPVNTGITYGISGMALVEAKEATATTPARRVFLVVHDNKKAGEGRVSLLTLQGVESPHFTPLAWPVARGQALPIDLEALAAVPGQPESFLALASDGIVTRLQLNEAHTAVQIATSFKLPNYKEGVRANFEGFSVAQLGPTLVAVWGQRGASGQPGTLHFATLDLETNALGPVNSATITAPWPAAESPVNATVAGTTTPNAADVRAISDLKLDASGALFVSSASDAGDDGPFNSALYLAGTLSVVNGTPQWLPSLAPPLLARFPGHKIEAFDFVPGASGGLAYGTDDENRGSSLWLN